MGEQPAAADHLVATDEGDTRPVEGVAVDGRRLRRHPLVRRQHTGAGVEAVGIDLGGDIGPERIGQYDRTVDVEHPRPLLQQVVVGQRLRGVLQDGLDQRRRRPRVGLPHQRHGAGHRRGGDRGPAHQHLCFGVDRGDPQRRHQIAVVGGGQPVPGRRCTIRGGGRSADNPVARRHQIGLQQVVGVRQAIGVEPHPARRSARAEVGHGVVVAGNGIVIVDRTHGNHRRVDAGGADRAVELLAGARLPEVAGRRHHRDAGGSGTARGHAQRIGLPALGRISRQAGVQHPDVVFLGVIDDPLDAFDRIADGAIAIVIEHPHVVDFRVRCDAGGIGRAGGIELGVAGGDRGHMRAVAERVLRRIVVGGNQRLVSVQRQAAWLQRSRGVDADRPAGRGAVEHVDVARNARNPAAVQKGVVRLHHPRIQHRDADAGPIHSAVAGLGAVGAHVARQRAGDRFERAGRLADFAVRRHADHVLALRQRNDGARFHQRRQRMNERILREHRTAGPDHERAQIGHLRVGGVADHDHLHVAHAPDVACPFDRRRGAQGDADLQVARYLALRVRLRRRSSLHRTDDYAEHGDREQSGGQQELGDPRRPAPHAHRSPRFVWRCQIRRENPLLRMNTA